MRVNGESGGERAHRPHYMGSAKEALHTMQGVSRQVRGPPGPCERYANIE